MTTTPTTDFAHGSGYPIAEGINSGRPQYLLCRPDTWDDIAAFMAANNFATLEDYDRYRKDAELCFPLPANASGSAAWIEPAHGGSSFRNYEYWCRLANAKRIGRDSQTAVYSIAEP